MKLEPAVDAETLRTELSESARRSYEADRADAIQVQIDHLSRMMAAVARMELDLTSHPLSKPLRRDRSER